MPAVLHLVVTIAILVIKFGGAGDTLEELQVLQVFDRVGSPTTSIPATQRSCIARPQRYKALFGLR